MSDLDVELKEYLVTTFGSDIKNLKGVKELYEEATEKKKALEKRLSVITTEVPTKIKAALTSAEETLEKVEEFELAKDCINSEVLECLEQCTPGVEKFQQSVMKVNEIERYMSYMKWVAKIEETSGEVQQYILSDSMEDACSTLKQLLKYYTSMLDNSTKCHHLTQYLKKTIIFWYNILKDKLSKDLDVILKQINWPFISGPGPTTLPTSPSTSEKVAPSPYNSPDPAAQLEKVVGNLLQIQLPSYLSETPSANGEQEKGHGSDKLESEKDVILLPFQLLLRPLKKRFRFHFTGNKPTNPIHKPEWYLTQVLNWINHHSGFLEQTMQAILDKHGYSHVDALMMFAQGLLQLVIGKLSVDIEEIIFIDELFSHTVDEVLLFDRELRVTYDISDSLLKAFGPLKVLSQPDCIKKWLNIENICASERLDALLTSEQAWQSKFTSSSTDEGDEMKTPECAESFITMLLTITDRYKNLPSYQQQLQFLDLQLLLLDDFRIRLTQVIRSVTSGEFDDISVAILNASFYVTIVLKEWADNVFFLELKYHKDKETENPSSNLLVPKSLLNLGENRNGTMQSTGKSTDETVFESTITLYQRIYQEGVENIVQAILAEFKAKSRPYLNDQWLALPPAEEQVTLVVSRSACPMLEVLQERLHIFEQKLCRALFTKLWRNVAENVDLYLYNEVAVANHFNAGGALQLQFDMNRNLFPLFGPFTSKPENYFKRMKEACLLLNLSFGSALLLKEAICEEDHPQDPYDRRVSGPAPVSVLSDVGVYLLKPNDVKRMLGRRIDWTTS